MTHACLNYIESIYTITEKQYYRSDNELPNLEFVLIKMAFINS